MNFNNLEIFRQTGRTYRAINRAIFAAKFYPEKSFSYYVLTYADKASLKTLIEGVNEFPDNLSIKVCKYYKDMPQILLDEESFYDHTVFESRYPDLINAYLESTK